MMALNETIYKRKSTRRFDMTSLEPEVLKKIESFISKLKPLHEDIKIHYEFTDSKDIKSIQPLKAPHYIVIYSEKKDGHLLNVGFMFQQLDLYIQSLGIGSVWLGLARYKRTNTVKEYEFVIVLAFGKAAGSPHRELSKFRRKSLSEIADIADEKLEPARLAPSGTNMQPWYFVHDDAGIHAYCIKHRIIRRKTHGRINKIDMGVALAHLYVANPDTFQFFIQEQPKPVNGYYYSGSFKI